MYNLNGWKILNIGKDPEKLRKEATEFIANKIEPLKNAKEFEFDFFDHAAENSSLILLGEMHHTQEIYDLEFEFIKYLNKFGYRNVILEIGYSSRYLIERYLETGDETYYPLIFDEGGLIKKIYEYNKELPEDKKISVWGFDVDTPRSELHGLEMIREYLKDENGCNLSELYWTDVSVDRVYWGYVDPSEKIRMLEMIKNETGDKRIIDIADSIISSTEIKYYSGQDRGEKREAKIKENFKKIYEEIDGETKIVMIAGWGHTRKSSQEGYGYEMVGFYLSNEFSGTKDSTYSIRLEPLSGTVYQYPYYPSPTMSLELSKIDSIVVNDIVIVDPKGTGYEGDYDSIVYLKKVSPAKRPWI